MKIGLFLPTCTNGVLASTTTPQFEPSFDKLLNIVTTAERYGIDFGLAMVKLHGFGGPSRYWNASLDSFTLTSALIARTNSIKLFATAPVLALPPALAARAASTIDSVSPGRFGLNIVTGWLRPEYESMGLWPGDEHYKHRYGHGAEYVSVLRELWSDGRSDFQGQFFKMQDCRVEPLPTAHIDIVSAGQSDAGLQFAAEHADYGFGMIYGTNQPTAAAAYLDRAQKAQQTAGREVGSFVTVLIIAAETDEEAFAKWRRYNEGTDMEAIGYAKSSASVDVKVAASTNSTSEGITQTVDAAVSLGQFIGSYESVARMLDEMAVLPGLSGIMLGLDDWSTGVETFGTKIQPLMKCRTSAASIIPSRA